MHDSHPCPQCGEMLEVPPAMLGRPVRCAACSRVFTPEDSTLAAEFDAPTVPRRRARRRREIEADGSSRRVVFLVLGIFGLLGLLCCGGFGFFAYKIWIPNWQPYESAEGQFTAKFPGKVEPSSFVTGRIKKNGTQESVNGVAAYRMMIQEEFFVYYVPLEIGELAKPDKLLNDFADGLLAQSPGCTEDRPRITHQVAGYEAMEVVLDLGDDRFTQARIILANQRAYIIGVTGPGKPDGGSPWVQEFIDSLQPKDAGKPRNGRNPFRGR